jgi:hypothetical protein
VELVALRRFGLAVELVALRRFGLAVELVALRRFGLQAEPGGDAVRHGTTLAT